MPLDKEALKARLLGRYAAQLDVMFEQLEGDGQQHLTAIEEQALKLRQEVGQAITEELVMNAGQKQDPDVACPECQQDMRYKGRKKRWMKTRTGDVQVERSYYYCEPCRTGHFPPG